MNVKSSCPAIQEERNFGSVNIIIKNRMHDRATVALYFAIESFYIGIFLCPAVSLIMSVTTQSSRQMKYDLLGSFIVYHSITCNKNALPVVLTIEAIVTSADLVF